MAELNITNGKGVIILTKYANFKKEYAELEYATKKFVDENIDVIKYAKDKEARILAAIELKSKVLPPAGHVEETNGLINDFCMSTLFNRSASKKIYIPKLFYLVELFKLLNIVDTNDELTDIIDRIFNRGDYDIVGRDFEFKSMSDEVGPALNTYRDVYNRFKDIIENIENNIEVNSSLTNALLQLSIIRLIVDPKVFDFGNVD